MRFVAHQSNIGRQRQEQFEQTIVMKTPRSSSPDKGHVKHLLKQLAYKDAQPEHARSQRDTHLVTYAKRKFQTYMHLLSNETPNWISRVVNETEQVLVHKSAEAAKETIEVQGPDKQYNPLEKVLKPCTSASRRSATCSEKTTMRLGQ